MPTEIAKIPLPQLTYDVDDELLPQEVGAAVFDMFKNDFGSYQKRPALDVFIDVGSGVGVDGVYWSRTYNILIVVSNGSIYKVSQAGVVTDVTGDTLSAGNPVTFTEGTSSTDTYIVMANGGQMVTYNNSGTTVKMSTLDAAAGGDGVVPGEGPLGIQVVSMGLILGEDEVLTWFHDMKRGATEEFLSNVAYGERDYLVVDIPAGTSSDTVNALAYIPDLDGALVVTVPSDVSQGVAFRAIKLCETAGIYPFGILENMSGFSCSKCGHRTEMFQTGGGDKLARQTNTPFLGKVPLSTLVSLSTNEGVPFVHKYPDIDASKVVVDAADLIDDIVAKNDSHRQ